MRQGSDMPIRSVLSAGGAQSAPCPAAGQGERLRLAIGIFAQPKILVAAMSSLADQGVPACRIEVLANEQILGQVTSAASSGTTAGSMSRLVAKRPGGAAQPWIFQSIADAAARCGEAVGVCSPPAADLYHRLVKRQAEQIDRALRTGGGVLLVEVSDDRQQQEVCSTLLRHAATGVQTHDIRSTGRPHRCD